MSSSKNCLRSLRCLVMAKLVSLRDEAAKLLFWSDRAYFEAGANQRRFDGGILVTMAGLEHVAAGCVVLPDLPLQSPRRFVSEATAAASRVQASLLRFYTPPLDADTAASLSESGLRNAVEWAFLRSASANQQVLPAGLVNPLFRRVSDAGTWADKLQLAAALEHLPDGKKAAAPEWTELERRKCEVGYMEMWLLEHQGIVCGSFGLAGFGTLLRLKNLVVHPTVRRLGFGKAAVVFACERAQELGFGWVGAFGIAGGKGPSLYSRCGFDIAGEQLEWVKPLGSPARAL
jgi:GNAT superfamily N-acetyltransferase